MGDDLVMRRWLYQAAIECKSPGVMRFMSLGMKDQNTKALLFRFSVQWGSRIMWLESKHWSSKPIIIQPYDALRVMAAEEGIDIPEE